MKKILIASAIAASSFIAPQAFAQAKNFEGASFVANLNLASTDSEIASNTINAKFSQSSQNLGLQAQYNFGVSESFVLGVGLTLGVGDLKLGNWTSGATNGESKQKESSSLYIAPGFAISPSVLVYGKIAALSSKVEASTAAASASATFSGKGFGIGFQNYFNKNLFMQAEVMQNNYDDKYFTLNNETDKGKATVLSIGVGYKF
jgi:outer membrane immunogenic protein